jgi:uncharacterized protein YbaR (Trm112 family)
VELTDLLRCPKTGQPLHFDEAALILRGENPEVTYPVIDGIVDFCPQTHDRVSDSYDKAAARYDPCITASTIRAKIVGMPSPTSNVRPQRCGGSCAGRER